MVCGVESLVRVLTAGVGSASLDVLALPSEPPDSSRPRSRCPGTPSAPPASMGEEHRLVRLFHAAASAYSTRHRWFRGAQLGFERRGSLFQTDPQERTKPNEASSDDAPSTHAYTHTQTQTYTDTDTKTDAHPERRSMIEEGGSRKKSSREVKGDRCQKEEVTLDHHWTS